MTTMSSCKNQQLIPKMAHSSLYVYYYRLQLQFKFNLLLLYIYLSYTFFDFLLVFFYLQFNLISNIIPLIQQFFSGILFSLFPLILHSFFLCFPVVCIIILEFSLCLDLNFVFQVFHLIFEVVYSFLPNVNSPQFLPN